MIIHIIFVIFVDDLMHAAYAAADVADMITNRVKVLWLLLSMAAAIAYANHNMK
jgi:hypothetical protein